MTSLIATAGVLAGGVLAAEQDRITTAFSSAGVVTFVATAIFAAAIILLGFDLVRRIRRAGYRAEIQEKLAAEMAEREASEADGAAERAAGGADLPGADPEPRDGPGAAPDDEPRAGA